MKYLFGTGSPCIEKALLEESMLLKLLKPQPKRLHVSGLIWESAKS